MTKRTLGSVCVAVWLGCFTAAAGQLPPDVLVDKYLLQARMLNEEKDHKGALEAMDRILALQKEHDLTLPKAFPFQYAQMAFAAGSVQATIDSANRYLTAAGREGKYYREALELLLKAEQKLQEPAVDRVGSTPVKPDLEPQPQAIPPSSAQTQETIAAQPMVDCKKWNSKKFFRKATVEDVTACINAGADPNARNSDNETPLHRAAKYSRNAEVFKALIAAGADLMALNKDLKNPFDLAGKRNKKLLEAAWRRQAYPFQYAQAAFAAGSLQAAIDLANRYLTAAGREGKYYQEALELRLKAERKLQEPAVDRVGSTAQPMVDCKKWNSKKFFRKATVEDVTACINAGADLDAQVGGRLAGCYKCTPLHRAALYNKNAEVVKALLKGGADPNARHKNWKATPLHLAAMYNDNPAVVKALIESGADTNAPTKRGNSTPLHWAVMYNKNAEVVKTLLKGGADPNARTKKWKSTPLHLAAKFNENGARFRQVTEALIAAGADLMALNKDLNTPIDLAGKRKKKILDAAWSRRPEQQRMAALARNRKERAEFRAARAQNSGPDYLGLALGIAGGAAVAAAGGGSSESIEAGGAVAETIMTGKAPAGAASPESATGAFGVAGGGPCQIPGYPKPPGGVKNLGLPWCPASVGLQVRAFALQAAGAQCAISLGSSSTPEQIESARREIRAACARLDAWGEGNCQCPPGLRQ